MRRFALIVLLAICARIYAEDDDYATDVPSDDVAVAEESVLRARSLPAAGEVAENWTSLSDVLDIFSARNLAKNWEQDGRPAVGKQCDRDITTYIRALKNQVLWALKGESSDFR